MIPDEKNGIAALRQFFEAGITKVFDKGQEILAETEEPSGAYLVVSGNVKVSSTGKSGDERIHLILGENDVFPLLWLFKRQCPIANYIAMDKVTVLYQPATAFNKFVAASPQALIPIIHELLTSYYRLYNLNIEPSSERVIDHLLFLADYFGRAPEQAGGYVVIDIKLTQTALANSVRLSRETTGKILNDLEAQDAVILGRKVIRVMPAKLRELLEA